MKKVECGACLELLPQTEAVERKRAFYCPTCIKDRPTNDITIHLFNEVEALMPEAEEMAVTDYIEEVSIALQGHNGFEFFESEQKETIEKIVALIQKHNFVFEM